MDAKLATHKALPCYSPRQGEKNGEERERVCVCVCGRDMLKRKDKPKRASSRQTHTHMKNSRERERWGEFGSTGVLTIVLPLFGPFAVCALCCFVCCLTFRATEVNCVRWVRDHLHRLVHNNRTTNVSTFLFWKCHTHSLSHSHSLSLSHTHARIRHAWIYFFWH